MFSPYTLTRSVPTSPSIDEMETHSKSSIGQSKIHIIRSRVLARSESLEGVRYPRSIDHVVGDSSESSDDSGVVVECIGSTSRLLSELKRSSNDVTRGSHEESVGNCQ
jgi:hypothetical protein